MAKVTVATDANEVVEVIPVTEDDLVRPDLLAELIDRVRWAVREALRREA